MPRLLVANRGEIAVRVLRTAKELEWTSVALYTEADASHASFADEAVKLGDSADFMKVELIVEAAIRTNCTHVHPGYGFLSENPLLPISLAKLPTPIIFVGPSPAILTIASDKMKSRDLAISLSIPIAPGLRVSSAPSVQEFAQQSGVGYPVMIKALDGGGGRGIRLVENSAYVEDAFKRCQGESPSKRVFVEKALTGHGWKHIEIQIIGDGTGAVAHFWERECSVQRRFQKIVEIAPSRLPRPVVQPLIDAALKMSSHLKYKGLGTFEYLINPKTQTWVFLEINPRVQVEHTITEEITDVDLVKSQLLLFSPPSTTLAELLLDLPPPPPTSYAVQLRINAEDPTRDFQLSPGTITPGDVAWPQGRGVRIDTWLTVGPNQTSNENLAWNVGTEFDSLLAKLIVRGRSFEELTVKSRRVLSELRLETGAVKTNAALVAGVLDHPDWLPNDIDTLWLERNLQSVLDMGIKSVGARINAKGLNIAQQSPSGEARKAGSGLGTTLLQPGTLFHLSLSPTDTSRSTAQQKHTVTLTSIGINAFPEKLSGSLLSSFSPVPLSFELAQSTAASISTSDFELANPNDTLQVAAPMTGKIVELHPALLSTSEGSKVKVKKGESILILSVMKMENAVVAPCDGYVAKLGKGIRAGVVLPEGMLICRLTGESQLTSRL